MGFARHRVLAGFVLAVLAVAVGLSMAVPAGAEPDGDTAAQRPGPSAKASITFDVGTGRVYDAHDARTPTRLRARSNSSPR